MVRELSVAESPEFTKQADAVFIKIPAMLEASGLAASRVHDGAWWMLNDSGGEAALYLAGADGADLGRAVVVGTQNIDWEDLASFSWKGKSYLLVADTGDNDAKRDHCLLHVLREPDLMDKKKGKRMKPEWTIRFRYPDGPRDCESVAVDAQQGKILLLSKRTQPPVLYELPLKPEKKGTVMAKKLGPARMPAAKGSALLSLGGQPTAMDISADGSMAAVLTYIGVDVFDRQNDESWTEAFAREPRVLTPHGLQQAEGVAFSKGGKSLHVISEGKSTPIITYK
jgi:hypothetical protein